MAVRNRFSELYTVYVDVEKFCLKRHIIKGGLFELTELSDVHKVVETVGSNIFFRLTRLTPHKETILELFGAAL